MKITATCRPLSIVVTHDIFDRLDTVAEASGLKKSEIVRRALTAYFSAHPVRKPRAVAAAS